VHDSLDGLLADAQQLLVCDQVRILGNGSLGQVLAHFGGVDDRFDRRVSHADALADAGDDTGVHEKEL